MKTVGYFYHPLFLEHTYPGHPENDKRLRAVMSLLREKGMLDVLQAVSFVAATEKELAQIHNHDYVTQVMAIAGDGGGNLGPDTYLNDASYKAAALAAGAAMQATRSVLQGQLDRAIVLARPPGHHAFADHGEGFCIFNNIAFAAKEALKTCDRVMIVDFDVHHGNGTQAIFYDSPDVLFISSHQMPLYPGSGHLDEIGVGAGRGATVNVPLLPGAGDGAMARVLHEVITPVARRFKPHLLLVSAGFDAHWCDPLAQLNVSLRGFAHSVHGLVQLSEELCDGRIVVALEGGYDLGALSYGVLNTCKLLRGEDIGSGAIEDPIGPNKRIGPEGNIDKIVNAVKHIHEL